MLKVYQEDYSNSKHEGEEDCGEVGEKRLHKGYPKKKH